MRWSREPRPAALADRLGPSAVLLVVALAVVAPFFEGQYLFALDHTVGPAWQPFRDRLFDASGAAYGGSLPLHAPVGLIAAVATPALAQKALFVGVLGAVAFAGYRFLPGSRWGRCFGALVLLVNPFVYERVLVGQILLVWGLAMLPVALVAIDRYLREGTARSLLLAVAAVTLLGVSAHALYAGALLFGILTLLRAREHPRRILGRAVTVVLVALPLNAYWLAPAVRSGVPGPASPADLATFAPRVEAISPLFTAAAMGGFWRDGLTTVWAAAPSGPAALFSPTGGCFAALLALAVYGVVTHYDDDRYGTPVRAVAVAGVLAVILGTGVAGRTAPLFQWLVETVPFFAGMRDANKFLVLAVLAYAYLGSLGVSALFARVRSLDPSRSIRVFAVVAVLALPLGYTTPMVSGYDGQIQTGEYPQAWTETAQYLDDAEAEGVLALPWHRYLDYPWLAGGTHRVSSLDPQFFDQPVVRAGRGPESRILESNFDLDASDGTIAFPDAARRLSRHGLSHVVLAKTADWRVYRHALDARSDLTPTFENDQFVVYRLAASSAGVSSRDAHSEGDPDAVAVAGTFVSAVTILCAVAVRSRRPERAAARRSRDRWWSP